MAVQRTAVTAVLSEGAAPHQRWSTSPGELRSSSTSGFLNASAMLLFFFFFSSPNVSRALLADLHLEVKCLAPIGHAASEPFDPCPDRREQSEALLLPGLRSELQALEAGPVGAASSVGYRQRKE